MPLYDGGCGALLTCLCAKLGRNGRKSKPKAEKCVGLNRFLCVEPTGKCGIKLLSFYFDCKLSAGTSWTFSIADFILSRVFLSDVSPIK